MINLNNIIENCESFNLQTSLSDQREYNLLKCPFKL